MSLISSLISGLGGQSSQQSSSYGYSGGGTGNSGAMATEFNRQMMEAQMAYNAQQAELARQHSSAEAQKQRDWQEQMRSTAYQTTVEDLKKAGINPILAASRGATDAGTGAMAGSISAASGIAGGVTDNNYGGENWSMMSGESYSNLGKAVEQGLDGIGQLVGMGGTTTGNGQSKGLNREMINSAKSIINAGKNVLGRFGKK